MLTIRQTQLDVLTASMAASRHLEAFAADLLETGGVDLTSAAHLAIIGGDEGTDPHARLARFARAARAEAARDGIAHPMLQLDYAGFPFRFGADWRRDDVVETTLTDPSLDEWQKMQRVHDRLLVAAPL